MAFLTQPITLQSISGINSQRKISTIDVDVILNESTTDTLTITKQPVQQGAAITDHAYKEPTQLSMTIHLGADVALSLSDLYKVLLNLQASRVPFDVITPKRIYRSMLFAILGVTTDKTTENILAINATFQEVIIVKLTTTTVPRARQRNPGVTGKTENAGKKSALVNLNEGIGKPFQTIK